MRKTYCLVFVSLIIIATACKSKDKPAGKSENYADAARNFIRAALDGKFSEASSFMLQDSINLNWLEVAERSYEKADQSIKNGYRASSIRIHQPILNVNDSTSIVIFSNSYKNDPDTLKVTRVNGNWLVDLKYLYQHDADTIVNTIDNIDSLQ